jgi:cytochrome c5
MKIHPTLLCALAISFCLNGIAVADTAKGQGVYMNFCASCHASGVAGAPKVGDQEAWRDRIGKGSSAMVDNAIKGFQGKNGFMPAKGGNGALTDEEVSSAVMYMMELSK